MSENPNDIILIEKIITLRNGELSITDATDDEIKKFTNVKSICETCKNQYADRCKKVSHPNKSYVSSYPFITSADQITDNNGEVQYFYINECVNYARESAEERRCFQQLAFVQNIRMVYGANEEYTKDKELNKEIKIIEKQQIQHIETPYQRARKEAQQRRSNRS